MKETNNFNISTSFVRMGPYHSVELASKSQKDFREVAKLGNVTRVSIISLPADGKYYVDALTIENEEYKGKQDKCSTKRALQILAGISQAISQTDG